jgi:peptide/nickel transport system ATP-binding protein
VGDVPAHRVRCVRAAELPVWRRRESDGVRAEAGGRGETVLAVERLRKVYRPRRGPLGRRRRPVQALHDVDLSVRRAETLAIVGESGCGKSTFARVLSGLETATAGTAMLGTTEIGGRPIDSRPVALRRQLQMVFQNPDSTLNPSHTAGHAIIRALRRLRGLGRAAARREAERLLTVVKLSPEFAARKPHQLSGGQRQRVAIARALAGNPDVIVADEPVSALDVSVQAAIVNLLSELQRDRGATLVFISHDLSVVRYLADHVAVMYLGKVVEFGTVDEVFSPPYHPYTEALLSAVPVPDPEDQRARIVLEGPLPSASERPAGCPFSSRCPRKVGRICDDTPPPEQAPGPHHRLACHIPAEELLQLQVAAAASR